MTKNEQIDGIFGVIDLWACNAVRHNFDGASVYNPYNAKELSVELYNAGYRKIDDNCAVITKDELKQYKAQAVKEFAEKLKNVIHVRDYVQGYAEIGLIEEIDELLKGV